MRQVYAALGGVQVGPRPLEGLKGQDQQEMVEYYQKWEENFKKRS